MSRLSSFNDSNQTIGTRIREKREQWHMSQQEVADAIGISQSYISRLEKRIIRRLRQQLEQMV